MIALATVNAIGADYKIDRIGLDWWRMASRQRISRNGSKLKTESVRSADPNRPARKIGKWTTTITPEKYEGYCATNVTSESVAFKTQKRSYRRLQTT